VKRPEIKTITHIECDGCQYGINAERQPPTVLRIPTDTQYGPPDSDDGFHEFEFHGPRGVEHDCFRYWTHDPHTMTRSLKERGWNEDQIEAFLSTHLYRPHNSASGLERKAVAR
jgi:hypothetical protein